MKNTDVKKRHNRVGQKHVRQGGDWKRAYGLPMLLQLSQGHGLILKLAEGPFVDNFVVAGVVEKTGGNPRLHNEYRQTPRLMEYLDQKGGAIAIEGGRKDMRTTV